MIADTKKEICEMIEQAEVVADPLEDLVEQTKTDPGAPFEPDMTSYLADLRSDDPASYQRLRDKLKKLGISVRELDRVTAKRSASVAAGGPKQAEILIGVAEEADLFHTSDGTPYADVQVTGHRRTFEISEDSGFAATSLVPGDAERAEPGSLEVGTQVDRRHGATGRTQARSVRSRRETRGRFLPGSGQ